MFARTRSAWLRSRIVGAVRRLVAVQFGLDGDGVRRDNAAWKSWLALVRQREPNDILALLKTDARDSLKARGLTIYLAPSLKACPFRWNDNTSLRNYHFMADKIRLASLSSSLQAFTFELISIYADYAYQHQVDQSLEENDAAEEIAMTRLSFNSFILQALELLPADDPRAAVLSPYFVLRDPVPYWNMDEASGYGQFGRLLTAPIPDRWKHQADQSMRRFVRYEVSGTVVPRKDWEAALPQYAEVVVTACYHGELRYQPELFASQVAFILDMAERGKKCYFPRYCLRQVLQQLTGDAHRRLRHRLARHVMLTPDTGINRFGIYDVSDLSTAKLLISGYDDEELALKFDQMLADYQARSMARQVAEEAEAATVSAVMSAMR